MYYERRTNPRLANSSKALHHSPLWTMLHEISYIVLYVSWVTLDLF
jgi:hypothetical protein